MCFFLGYLALKAVVEIQVTFRYLPNQTAFQLLKECKDASSFYQLKKERERNR